VARASDVMSDRVKVTCYACGSNSEVPRPVSRRETCAACGMDLRCCLNCRFHDPSAYNECREPAAERVVEKDRSNVCDHFAAAERGASDAAAKSAPGDDLERLFSKR
jgi:hypothetical protein